MDRPAPYGAAAIAVTAIGVAIAALVVSLMLHEREPYDAMVSRLERQIVSGSEIPPPRDPWPARHPIATAIGAGAVVVIVMRLYLFLWRVEHQSPSPPVHPPAPRKTPPAP